MLRRCRGWDYRGRGIYMVTLTLRDRSRPLLGRLVTDSDGGGDPEKVRARIEPTDLGSTVEDLWGDLASLAPQAKPLARQLMPDHFHGIVFVRGPMPRPLGNLVAAFKAGCTKTAGQPIWASGFHDSILFGRDQLDRMFAYVRDNPRRLAVKRLHPDLFQVRRPLALPGWPGLEAIGNPFLLDRPNLLQVQCSRRIAPEALAEKKEELLAAARHGAVLVSPCISPGEKEIAAAAFEEGLPLVTILENGFAPLYKPAGKRFDACAAGRLLLLAPWPHHTDTRTITRAQCLALNRLAEEVCALRAEARSTEPASRLPGGDRSTEPALRAEARSTEPTS